MSVTYVNIYTSGEGGDWNTGKGAAWGAYGSDTCFVRRELRYNGVWHRPPVGHGALKQLAEVARELAPDMPELPTAIEAAPYCNFEALERLDGTRDGLAHALYGAFAWSATKDGLGYWSDVTDKLYG